MRCTLCALPGLVFGWALPLTLLVSIAWPQVPGSKSWPHDLSITRPYEPRQFEDSQITDENTPAEIPEIRDEPTTVDPASFLPEILAKRVTVDFSDSSLQEIAEWLENEQGVAVLLKTKAMEEIGVTPSDPVSDNCVDEPLYLLLNRLESLGLAWYYEDSIAYITTINEAESHLQTETYNVGDLLDQEYKSRDLEDLIMSCVDVESWSDVGGPGSLYTIGDVIFVTSTQTRQLEVQCLLKGLRDFGRRTMIADPADHNLIRQALQKNVSVDFKTKPLEDALDDLSNDAEVKIRLDLLALRDLRIRERELVNLTVRERSLATVLDALLSNLELTWIIRDGRIVVTSKQKAYSALKTAIFDVRDLCRDASESEALMDAVQTQSPDEWSDVGGPSSLVMAKPGVLTVSAREEILDEVLQLLQAYRTAIAASKPRNRNEVDPQEVVTTYYKMHANVAEALLAALPMMVASQSWKTEENVEAPGTITLLPSNPGAKSTASPEDESLSQASLRAVLIIAQTRQNHEKIREIISRVQFGDSVDNESMGGPLGGAMGGFGGGMFRISESPRFDRDEKRP